MLLKHFTTWLPENIDFGKTYSTNWKESNYWINKKNNEKDSEKVINGIITNISTMLKICGHELNLSELSSELLKTKYYSELLKEYIFEEVRINEFSDKPSRKNSMFLAPNEIDIFDYAKRLGYDLKTKYFYEIELHENKKIHFADLTLLNCNTFSHAQKVENAKQYWEGVKKPDYNTEILFEGQFKIIKAITE